MLDSWLPHHFSAAGVPTNADECLEAVQSDLTGHSARFLMVYGICSTCKLSRACSKQLCLPRGQYNSWSKHFFFRSWLQFDTVSKKAFNLPLLPCLMLQAAWLKRFYCFVLTLALKMGISKNELGKMVWKI